MNEKLWVGGIFLLFVVVRARWPRGSDEREQVQSFREWCTSTIFTFSLLIAYGVYFWTSWIASYRIELPVGVQFSGGVFAFGGVVLLEWVHRALGEHFSPHLELRSDHRIVQEGPYAYVRHPMYTSGLLFLVGAGVLSNNWMVLIVPTFSFLLLLALRIRDEEQMLAERFGISWERYVQRTGRLLPLFPSRRS